MDFGFSIPTRGPLADAATIVALARRGEALGFNYLTFSDHIVIPRTIDSPYPYADNRRYAGAQSGDCFEQLSTLAFVAGATSRIRVLTSVMVVPHRPPVLTAKMLASIDVLSGGRVTVGCGAGWMAEEFAAVGAPPFKERGKVTDEYLAIFKTLWTQAEPRFAGTYARFDNISFLPKPVQRPHPPLWIGGESPAAFRRVVRFGDAWYPIGSNPEFPLNSLARYRAARDQLEVVAHQAGRDPASIDRAYVAIWPYERAIKMDDGTRQLLTGGEQAVIDDVRAMAELGVRHVIFNVQRATLDESIAAMERLAAVVMPLAG